MRDLKDPAKAVGYLLASQLLMCVGGLAVCAALAWLGIG